MNINIIAAVAENRAIGYKNRLIYSISEDMQRFKALTTGHTIIMGRKTFESLPHGALPHRRNIVLSRKSRLLDGCEVANSLDEALQLCKVYNEKEVFIIGGAEVYRQAIGKANRLYLTEIKSVPDKADSYFPDYSKWKIIHKEDHTTYSFSELIPPDTSKTSESSSSSSDSHSKGRSTIGS